MRIVCPSCATAYDVPDSLVTTGRVVRCAQCGKEWTPVEGASPPLEAPSERAEPPLAAPPPPARDYPASRVSAMDRLAAHPAPLRSSMPLRLAWAASILVIGLAAWAGYAWRNQIVEVWPPSARIYVALGMHRS